MVGCAKHLLADAARDRPATVMYVSKPDTAAEMSAAQIELAMEPDTSTMLVPPHGPDRFHPGAAVAVRDRGEGGGGGCARG